MEFMEFNEYASDEAVLGELGRRLAAKRLDRCLTQAELASQAGVSKRTLERLEAGDSTQLTSLIRVLRALELVTGLNRLVPAPLPSPIDALKLKGKSRSERKRARPGKRREREGKKTSWTWGDEK